MKPDLHVLAPALLLVSLSTLMGCVYVPPVWDIGDAINDVEWIEPGVTTKEQVIERLGDPFIIGGEHIIYVGNTSYGAIVTYGGGGEIGRKPWSIYIDLDEAGTVQKVTKLEASASRVRANQMEVEESKTREELKARAGEGDVQAMYEYGYRLNDLEKAWVWFCPAAHKGHAESQFALANYYRWGHSPVRQNFIKSYLWRTLSLNGGDPRAANARDQTAQEMTADQIAEAESLATKWKPNPAECQREAKLAAE